MKKIVLSIISNVLMVFIPLMANPSLILHPKILMIMAGSVCVWLTQPAFSVAETNDKKQSDRFSVILILLMSLISGIVPIVDWAYINPIVNSSAWMTVAGLIMILTGIVFRAWAVRTLGEYFTPTVQIKK